MTSTAKQFDAENRRHHRVDRLFARANGLIGDYIKRKRPNEDPLRTSASRRNCSDTYGVMIYQEQVMAAASNRLVPAQHSAAPW
jgi:hypothetical protein